METTGIVYPNAPRERGNRVLKNPVPRAEWQHLGQEPSHRVRVYAGERRALKHGL